MAEEIKIAACEAKLLTRYLVGKNCPAEIQQRYAEAVNKLNASFSAAEEVTWNKMLSSLFYLKLIDGGLAITNAQSPLRKRIFIMLTLLECSPDFTEYFLPQPRSIFYIVPLGFRAGVSALYLLLGTLTVKALAIK